MAAQDNLGSQFGFNCTQHNKKCNDISFKYEKGENLHSLNAIHGDRIIGFMDWHPETGHIKDIKVNNDLQRQGIGTRLWNKAQEISGQQGIVAPTHSPDRTKAGDSWARKVGGELPKVKWKHY